MQLTRVEKAITEKNLFLIYNLGNFFEANQDAESCHCTHIFPTTGVIFVAWLHIENVAGNWIFPKSHQPVQREIQ